ncbi:MAG: V-type ATP synthase subunit E family protein [Candidatus Edwardsbacteria bacterium]
MNSELIALLTKEAEEEKEKILKEAKEKAEVILLEAKSETSQIIESHRQQLERNLNNALMRSKSTTNLKASALVLQTKDKLLEEIFEESKGEFGKRFRNEEYAEILKKLLEETLSNFSSKIIIEVAENNIALAKKVIAEFELKDFILKPSGEITGGVRVSSEDGTLVVTNTFSSRLERAKPFIIAEIAEILWG